MPSIPSGTTVWHYTPEGVEKGWRPMVEACKEVGRDPATLELTAGTMARILAPGEERPDDAKGVCGEPEEVAEAMRGFEAAGVKHLIVIVSPEDIRGVERFGTVVELLRQA